MAVHCTPEHTFTDRLIEAITTKRTILCVGLDPQLRYMPPHLMAWAVEKYGKTFEAVGQLFLRFNKEIIDATARYACAFKPQIAFYLEYGVWGIWAYEQTVAYLEELGLVRITDAKSGDGGDTADAYSNGWVGKVDFWDGPTPSPVRTDAVTIHGWIGDSCVLPFVRNIKEHGTGAFVVDKTSFKPNSAIEQLVTDKGMKVWEALAHLVDGWSQGTEGREGFRNLGVVMGATYEEDAPKMREILPDNWFLVPGFGRQGGSARGAVAGLNRKRLGILVNSSGAIDFAYQDAKSPFQGSSEDFALCAGCMAELSRNEQNQAMLETGGVPW